MSERSGAPAEVDLAGPSRPRWLSFGCTLWTGSSTLLRCLLLLTLITSFWGRSQPYWQWTADRVAAAGQQVLPDAPWLWTPLADGLRQLPGSLYRGFDRCVESVSVGAEPASRQFSPADWRIIRFGIISCVGGLLIPVLLSLLIGPRHPRDMGLAWPNRFGLRVTCVAIVVSLPLVVLMAIDRQFVAFYNADARQTPWYGPVVLATFIPEHLLLQGIVLSWLHPSRRLRPSDLHLPDGLVSPLTRRDGRWQWQWLDFWQHLRIPASWILPVIISGWFFWYVHLGKAPIELWLSLPGGMALAWLTVRSGSVLVPIAIHLATAVTAYSLAVYVLGAAGHPGWPISESVAALFHRPPS